jgi:hypothetical protein
MPRRVLATVLALTLLLAGLSGCQRKVSVQTGERITCRFGDVIKDTVHMVQVPAPEATLYSVKTSFGICERHEKLLSLYEKAQNDISANKLAAAQQELGQVVAGDPKFAQAAAQLAALKAGERPVPDLATGRQATGTTAANPGGTGSQTTPGGTGSTTGGNKPPSADTPVGPTVTLAAWAPAALDGFKTGATAADVLALSREYVPAPENSSLEAIVISVEQFSSGKMASVALKDQMSHYGKNVTSEKVAGRASIFGTDGKQFAALGFVSGAMLVIVEGHTQKGAQPYGLHDEIVTVATALPVK